MTGVQKKTGYAMKFSGDLNVADMIKVNANFDFGDLLTIKYLMHKCDVEKLLKLAHLREWQHDKKWRTQCPVCVAEDIILMQVKNN